MFYNGEEKQPKRRILKLSDAYEIPTENPKLEQIAHTARKSVDEVREIIEQANENAHG